MSQGEALRIVAVGDLSFNGRLAKLVREEAAVPFAALVPSWQLADLRLANLESPITRAARAVPYKLTLRAPDAALTALRLAGFDALGLANNHMLDFGPQGLAETCAGLAAAELPFVGAGPDDVAARQPLLLERQGQAVGLLAYCAVEQKSPLFAGPATPGVAAFDIARCIQDVRELRKRVDWLVVQLHWGEELCLLPSPQQRAWARALVAAGADLLLGHHPHVLQPMELIDGTPVYFSLGNCVFSDMFWRGWKTHGEQFVSRYRLHPLSAHTGWAEVILRRGHPAQARFHPARLRKNSAVVPDGSRRRRQEWDELCGRLRALDYATEYARESDRANNRRLWQASWRSPLRRLELLLYRHGLLPHAVEDE
jgi:hypothetical protein